MPLTSWVDSANDGRTGFPLENLPCGVFVPGADLAVDAPASGTARDPAPGHGLRPGPDIGRDIAPGRCCTAIGDRILDLCALEEAGVLDFGGALRTGDWTALMARGPADWARLRGELTAHLARGAPARGALEPHLHPAPQRMALPFRVAEYTDFYASRHHAEAVGALFRGPGEALPPNWLHMPIGYNGRASSVVVSGTPVRRPHGQIMAPGATAPRFGPSDRFDYELELGAVVGQPSDSPLTVAQADAAIFGYVLLNDWSARDIQAWEYRPLGPFQGKATATTIGAWIVTAAALAPFRVAPPPRAQALLPYLADAGPMALDVALEVAVAPAGGAATTLARTNARELYYTAAQQLAHHASSGCPMRVGDLLGSGTISGPGRDACGSLLELSRNGTEPVALDGGTRTFLADGDTVMLSGAARGDGYRIGFGACAGTLLPARWP